MGVTRQQLCQCDYNLQQSYSKWMSVQVLYTLSSGYAFVSPQSPIGWPTRALGKIWEANRVVSVVWLLPIWKLFLSEASRPFTVKNCYLPSLGANWDCMCHSAHSWQMARSPSLPYVPLFPGKARAHEQIWLVQLWPWVSLKQCPCP